MKSMSRRFSHSMSAAALLTVVSFACAAQVSDSRVRTGTGALQLTQSSYAVAQSKGSLTVTVARAGGSSGTATVSYSTASGSAVAGSNYTATKGTLQWAAHDAANKTFEVPINTTAFSGSKTFSVKLSNAAGARLGTPVAAVVTVSGSTTGTGGGSGSGTGVAATLAAKLGKPARLLVGLGHQGNNDAISGIVSQALKPDIYEEYLANAGNGDWTTWNSPAGAYVGVVASAAEQVGAVPMFTLYQMATNGDGNLSGLTNSAFMSRYWSNVRLMYQQIAAYGKPALVNLEPDFWGYTDLNSGGNPAALPALVTINSDCATLSNDVAGIGACLVKMARQYAPKAYVGFSPSDWGANSVPAVVSFMNAVGAQHADFIAIQTLDRDAGCFEMSPQPPECVRGGGPWYWDESNQTSPNFTQHLANVQTYHAGIGGLPVIWWQTPMGVPAGSRGGSDYHYRDNRENYFLTHPSQLTAVGGLGVVFSSGEIHQTTIFSDGGQFQSLDNAYLRAPAALR
jgi:hypothetical protein